MIARSAGSGEWADVSGAWTTVSELDVGGALLVRPDGHVAWRQSRSSADARQACEVLLGALAKLLCIALPSTTKEAAA